MNRKCVPVDQIKKLSYGEHLDGYMNPYDEHGTEYQSKFCTFKLKSIEDTEISKLERQRIVKMMEYLPTTQKRSYTNPFDSHYAVLKTKIAEQPKDHKEIVQEWMLKNIRMNGLTEYQTAYDGKNII